MGLNISMQRWRRMGSRCRTLTKRLRLRHRNRTLHTTLAISSLASLLLDSQGQVLRLMRTSHPIPTSSNQGSTIVAQSQPTPNQTPAQPAQAPQAAPQAQQPQQPSPQARAPPQQQPYWQQAPQPQQHQPQPPPQSYAYSGYNQNSFPNVPQHEPVTKSAPEEALIEL